MVSTNKVYNIHVRIPISNIILSQLQVNARDQCLVVIATVCLSSYHVASRKNIVRPEAEDFFTQVQSAELEHGVF